MCLKHIVTIFFHFVNRILENGLKILYFTPVQLFVILSTESGRVQNKSTIQLILSANMGNYTGSDI
jgi:hypothetical protein